MFRPAGSSFAALASAALALAALAIALEWELEREWELEWGRLRLDRHFEARPLARGSPRILAETEANQAVRPR